MAMTTLEKLEKAVTELNPEEIRAFADWFAEFQADQWDRKIEQDALDGRLDKLIERALEDDLAGRTTPL